MTVNKSVSRTRHFWGCFGDPGLILASFGGFEAVSGIFRACFRGSWAYFGGFGAVSGPFRAYFGGSGAYFGLICGPVLGLYQGLFWPIYKILPRKSKF